MRAYVGTAGIKLPAMDFPNGFAGADPAFAPYTQFDSSGRVTGGYGPVTEMTNRSHSSYHALQVSAQKNLTASGLGFQASYTFSKSIDDYQRRDRRLHLRSIGRRGADCAENPFDAGMDKGPSSFDIKQCARRSASSRTFMRIACGSCGRLGKTLTARVAGAGHRDPAKRLCHSPSIRESSRPASARSGTDRPDQIGDAGSLDQPHHARGLFRARRQ